VEWRPPGTLPDRGPRRAGRSRRPAGRLGRRRTARLRRGDDHAPLRRSSPKPRSSIVRSATATSEVGSFVDDGVVVLSRPYRHPMRHAVSSERW